MSSYEIRKLSHQNYVAAGVIQRCWRGHRCRKKIWSYGGERYNFCVLKVQCAWRIRMANKHLLQLWHWKVFKAAHTMQSLYYRWHSKRLRWILHLSFLKKCVVKIQSAYRRRAAKRLFELVKEAFRNRTALRIQASIRKFIGRCRVWRRRRLIDILVRHIQDAAPVTSNLSSSINSPTKTTLAQLPVPAFKNEINACESSSCKAAKADLIARSHQEVLDRLVNQVVRILHKLLIMNQFHQALVDTERNLQLIDMQMMIYEQDEELMIHNFDITNPDSWPTEEKWSISQSHTPLLMILRTILLICKSCCWAKYGRTKQVNNNILEQTLGTAMSMMYEQRRYFAMWCHRRRLLANEKDRLMRDYEAKVKAIEKKIALQMSDNSSLQNSTSQKLNKVSNAGRRISSMSNMSSTASVQSNTGRRHVSMYNMSQRDKSINAQHNSSSNNLNRKASLFALPSNFSASSSVMSSTTSWRIPPPPRVPVVPEYEDIIQAALHRRIWHHFSLVEILDVFHTIASWPRYSLLTQYDACFCKSNLLHVFIYLEHWQHISAGSAPQLFRDLQLEKEMKGKETLSSKQKEDGDGDDDNQSVHSKSFVRMNKKISLTNNVENNDDNDDDLEEQVSLISQDSLSQLNIDFEKTRVPSSLVSTSHQPFHMRNFTALKKLILPLFGFSLQQFQNSSSDFSNSNNIDLSDHSYARMQHLMQRAWRLTERAKHLISSGSPESYELHQRLEFMGSMNVPARIICRQKKRFVVPVNVSLESLYNPVDSSAVNVSSNSNKYSNGGSKSPVPAAISPVPGAGKNRRRMSSVSFQEEKNTTILLTDTTQEDDAAKPFGMQVTLSVQYNLVQAGAMIFLFGHIDDFQLKPGDDLLNEWIPSRLRSNWVDLCLQHTDYREIPYLLDLFGSVPLQPFVMFSHEIKQLATSQNLYIVRGALYKPSATTTLKAFEEEPEEDAPEGNEGNDDDDDDGEDDNDTKATNEQKQSSLSKKPVLDMPRFQDYVFEALQLSYVPILSSASATSSFNVPYRPLIFLMDDEDTDHAQQRYQPPVSSRIQPRLSLTIPYLQEKRDRSINFNEIRYATLLLQRMYRGFAGRLKFKKIASKKKEIMRRWWLACKVFDRLKLMRQKHETNAIVLQAHIKGYLWRKHLLKLKRSALICQCAFRIFRAKSMVYQERLRRDGGPQVFDMLRGGQLVTFFDDNSRDPEKNQFTVDKIYRIKRNKPTVDTNTTPKITCMLQIFRCGYNYRLEGFDMLLGRLYHGHLHQSDLVKQLAAYNEDLVLEQLQSQSTMQQQRTQPGHTTSPLRHHHQHNYSLAQKQAQIQLWQHEKVVQFILRHVTLVHRLSGGTQSMGVTADLADGHDLCLVVTYTPSRTLSDIEGSAAAALTQTFYRSTTTTTQQPTVDGVPTQRTTLFKKLQTDRKPDFMQHPLIEYAKEMKTVFPAAGVGVKPTSSFKELRQQQLASQEKRRLMKQQSNAASVSSKSSSVLNK